MVGDLQGIALDGTASNVVFYGGNDGEASEKARARECCGLPWETPSFDPRVRWRGRRDRLLRFQARGNQGARGLPRRRRMGSRWEALGERLALVYVLGRNTLEPEPASGWSSGERMGLAAREGARTPEDTHGGSRHQLTSTGRKQEQPRDGVVPPASRSRRARGLPPSPWLRE